VVGNNERKPWVQKKKIEAASARLKMIQEHIRVRRHDLVNMNQIKHQGEEITRSEVDHPKESDISTAKLLTSSIRSAKHGLGKTRQAFKKSTRNEKFWFGRCL